MYLVSRHKLRHKCYLPRASPGGDSPIKMTGVLVENFEKNP